MNATEKSPSEGVLDKWWMDLWWLLAASYAIGLVTSRGFEAFRGFAPDAQSRIFDVSHVLFGAVALGSILAITVGSFTVAVAQPSVRDRAYWHTRPTSDPPPYSYRTFRILRFLFVWLPQVLFPIVVYFFFLGFAAGGDFQRPVLFVGAYMTPVALLWTFQFIAKPLDAWHKGATMEVADIVLAAVAGVRQGADSTFHFNRLLVFLAFLPAPFLYTFVTQSFGGGLPVPVRALSQPAAQSCIARCST